MQYVPNPERLSSIPTGNLPLGFQAFVRSTNTTFAWDGTSWRPFSGSGRLEYLNPADPVTIYVREDGYDDSGDGKTVETAYRQPDRARRDIPMGANGRFLIDCGPGDFEFPTLEPVASTTQITYRADVSNPLIDATGAAISTPAGFTGRRTLAVGAYPEGSFAPGDVWLYRQISTADIGYVVVDSTSPDITIQYGINASSGTLSVYSYNTRLHLRSDIENVSASNSTRTLIRTTLSFVGFDIHLSGTSNSIGGCTLSGCRTTRNTANALYLLSCAAQIYTDPGLFVLIQGPALDSTNLNAPVFGCYISGALRAGGVFGVFNSSIGETLSPIMNNTEGSFQLSGVDFLSFASSCISSVSDYKCSVYVGFSGITVHPARTSLSNGPISWKRVTGSSAVISGSTTGTPVVLTDGAQAISIRAMCNGTLTNSVTPANEIQVGNNAPITFADLTGAATTDVAAVPPQFCRAT